MTTFDRITEAWGYYRSIWPLVTRATLRERQRDAFELGADWGSHHGLDSTHLSPRPAKRARRFGSVSS